jgi:hypothetical protein
MSLPAWMAIAAPIMRDHPIALRQEEQHLTVPGVGAERRVMVEHDRLHVLRVSVLVEEIGAIGCGDRHHRISPRICFEDLETAPLRRRDAPPITCSNCVPRTALSEHRRQRSDGLLRLRRRARSAWSLPASIRRRRKLQAWNGVPMGPPLERRLTWPRGNPRNT